MEEDAYPAQPDSAYGWEKLQPNISAAPTTLLAIYASR